MSKSGFVRMSSIMEDNEALRRENAALRHGLVSGAEEYGVCWGLMYADFEGVITRRMAVREESLEEALDATWTGLSELERRRYRARVRLMRSALEAWKQ